jgi:hypothetical protein
MVARSCADVTDGTVTAEPATGPVLATEPDVPVVCGVAMISRYQLTLYGV